MSKLTTVALDSLTPDPRNVRAHTDVGRAALVASVGAFGAARSVVVDGNGVVRAGNGTLEAAKASGMTEALIVETDGTQLVVVKRPDWSDEQALAYAIADNRTGELSSFDTDALKAAIKGLAEHALMAESLLLVNAVGYTERELSAILGQAPPAPAPGPGVREVSLSAMDASLEHECPRCKFRF